MLFRILMPVSLILSYTCLQAGLGQATHRRSTTEVGKRPDGPISKFYQDSLGLRFRYVRGGWATMGVPQNRISPPNATITERRRHLHLRSFYICTKLITNREFLTFVLRTGYHPVGGKIPKALAKFYSPKFSTLCKHPEHVLHKVFLRQLYDPRYRRWNRVNDPVVFVSPADAQAFCHWLSVRDKRQYHLPTADELEYASQLGGDSSSRPQNRRNGWFLSNSDGYPHPVGLLRPDRLGIYDLRGDVFEMTGTRARASVLSKMSHLIVTTHSNRPTAPGPLTWAIGGCFCAPASASRRYLRYVLVSPNLRLDWLGFRIVAAVRAKRAVNRQR